jgi:CheY-like chemotaxis protein
MSQRRNRIAIVADDDEATRRLISTWLSELGFEVHWARDGIELIERLESLDRAGRLGAPFLVVTDLDMPRRDGLAALDLIRERYSDARVLVATAFGDPRMRARIMAAGAAHILDKPFNMGRFAELAADALGGNGAWHRFSDARF